MRIKTIIALGVCLGAGKFASAQSNLDDLVRYSGIQYQGTARSAGAGNAFGAVGADFGAIGINPAGLGLYQRSEFTATVGFDDATTTGNYLGNSVTNSSIPNFNVGDLGIVIASNRAKKGKDISSGWLAVNWGIGFTRTNNFYSSTLIEGNNTNNSILAYYKEDANYQQATHYQLGGYGGLAYGAFLIDPFPNPKNPGNPNDSSNYLDRTRFDNNKINVRQEDNITTSGATNNISLSVAGNYLGKLYLGLTVNVPTVSFNSDRTFTETNNNPSSGKDSEYISSSLNETLTTTGVGINAAFGAIYKFGEVFRLGLSVQVPTLYSLTDVFSTTLEGNTVQKGELGNGDVTASSSSDPNGFQYTIVTPARATLSGALFLGKNGFISADYEYSDYSTARLNNSGGNDYSDFNQSIQKSLQGVNTLRVGAEYRIQAFSIRAGYDYITSPYKSGLADAGYSDTYSIISFGVGFRAKNMGLDLTYQLLTNNTTYTPYILSDPADIAQYGYAPSADLTTMRGNLMLTYSSRF